MDDAALLEGVPDEIAPDDAAVLADVPMDDDDAAQEAAEEAEEDAAKEAAERVARAARFGIDVVADAATTSSDSPAADAALEGRKGNFSGKRKVVEHTLSPGSIVGVDLNDAEERAKREARAAKFGVPLTEPAAEPTPMEAPPIIDADEVAARHARASKWGMEPVDPLTAIERAAPKDAYWVARRDASADEAARPEAVHVFGTDRMSSEDLLLYFVHGGTAPKHVEWVNDSSANVVFVDAADAAAAVGARTAALIPGVESFDPVSWRTMPPALGTAGKGLQLVFRMATAVDVKPPKRGVSRYYGEQGKDKRRLSGGKAGNDKRAARREAAGPYGGRQGGGKTLAETISAGKTLADVIADSAYAQTLEQPEGGRRAPPTKVDLRSKLAGRKEKAQQHEAGALPDLRASLGGGVADFKRGRADKPAAGDDDDDDDGGGGRSNFSYAAAKEELGMATEVYVSTGESVPAEGAAAEAKGGEAAAKADGVEL